jgi:phenylalanyl-tRNA synthetase beta chain
MKITLNWLKRYVDFDGSAQELADRLTMLGVEVEGVQKLGGAFEGVVVAQILASDKHPNADKLSVCRVADGHGERQIVCGAKNYSVGDKVPLILPGNTLPPRAGEPPLTIRAGRIRGVESQGMLCSPQELGLPDAVDGLLILRPEAKVGQPFAEYLSVGGSDVVYDLEITPNRPDLNSVIGIAREVSAVTGHPLRLPEIKLPNVVAVGSSPVTASDLVAVRIEDPELCPRYVARVIRGVKIGPSPDWLKSTLEKVGVRTINNVVDVTNYVMLETGQPLHAFDYHLLKAPSPEGTPAIVVRPAMEGEKFTTLDGHEHVLTGQMLLIADETRAIALAGIMGGQNSEINPNTVDVLLETACFKPQNVRSTSKKLELRTESSYRFERGVDPAATDWASQRAAQLILETAGGQLASGAVDVQPRKAEPAQITLRHVKVCELLGVEVPVRRQIEILQRLGLVLIGAEHGVFNAFRVPTYRVDLKREVDLIEEITRLYGIDNIPTTPPRGAIGSNSYDLVHDSLGEARRILTGLGLFEAQGQTLISDKIAERLDQAVAPQTKGQLVHLANPLSSEMNVLRPELIFGLLDALRHNVHHKTTDLALFEIGRVFRLEGNGELKEERRLAIALTGRRDPVFWSGTERGAKVDAYDLKGLLEEFFEQFAVRGMSYSRREESTACYLESAVLQIGSQPVGEIGQLLPVLAKQYDLRDAVLVAELNIDLLLARRSTAKTLKPLPQFPAIERDVAMVLPETTRHEAVLATVKQAKVANLETVNLFDVYRGQNVPAGQKSVAYSFTYRSPERTLTDAEVNSAHQKIVEQLRQSLGAVVRE